MQRVSEMIASLDRQEIKKAAGVPAADQPRSSIDVDQPASGLEPGYSEKKADKNFATWQ